MRISFAIIVPLLALTVLTGAGCQNASPAATGPSASSTTDTYAYSSSAPVMSSSLAFPGVRPPAELQKKVRIKTNKGDIVIQIDPQAGPNAASNFLYLVQQNFYSNIIFHRVIPGFMIQGGDPTGTGMSGPGYNIPDDKVAPLPQRTYPVNGGVTRIGYYPKGTVAMARTARPNSGGSQFFIMVDDYPLDPVYAVFGKVIEGQEIADAISEVDRDPSDRPLEDVVMQSVAIEE